MYQGQPEAIVGVGPLSVVALTFVVWYFSEQKEKKALFDTEKPTKEKRVVFDTKKPAKATTLIEAVVSVSEEGTTKQD